ncbi:MAG: HmuY family protein [Nitrospinota bacterium]
MSRKDKLVVLSIFLLTPVLLTFIIWPNLSKVMMGEVEDLAPPEEINMVRETAEDGVVTQMIDASQPVWVYFSFKNGVIEEARGKEAFLNDEWDLAFQRKRFLTNSGGLNPDGKVSVFRVEGADFSSNLAVPSEGFVLNGRKKTKIENPMTQRWYSYNFLKHKLTPKRDVYFIKTHADKVVKMKIENYYCGQDNTSACYTIKYKWL